MRRGPRKEVQRELRIYARDCQVYYWKGIWQDAFLFYPCCSLLLRVTSNSTLYFHSFLVCHSSATNSSSVLFFPPMALNRWRSLQTEQKVPGKSPSQIQTPISTPSLSLFKPSCESLTNPTQPGSQPRERSQHIPIYPQPFTLLLQLRAGPCQFIASPLQNVTIQSLHYPIPIFQPLLTKSSTRY